MDGESSELASVWMDPGRNTVCIVGEIDLSNSRELMEAVTRRAGSEGDLILDLAGLDFVDCSGLHAIAGLAERLGRHQSKLVIKSPRGIVRRAIEIARLFELPGLVVEPGPGGEAPPGPEYIRIA